MCNPCVHAILVEEVEIGTDHVRLSVGPLLVGDDTVEEACIIMAEFDITADVVCKYSPDT